MVNNSMKIKQWLKNHPERSHHQIILQNNGEAQEMVIDYWLSCEQVDDNEVVIIANVLNLGSEDREVMHHAHKGVSEEIKEELEIRFDVKPHVVVLDPEEGALEF